MNQTISQRYFPAFSTKEAELRGFAELAPKVLDKIVPVIMLSRLPQASSLEPSLFSVMEIAETRPVILDFAKELRAETSEQEAARKKDIKDRERLAQGLDPVVRSNKQQARDREIRESTRAFNRDVTRLSNPEGGFSAWRTMVGKFSNAIPVIQRGTPRQMADQVRAYNEMGSAFAFRLNISEPGPLSELIAVARHVTHPEKSILLFDGGYVRGISSGIAQKMCFALEEIKDQVSWFDSAVKVSLSGSFPTSLANAASPLEIEERVLYDHVRSAGWQVRYGDYSSVQLSTGQAGGSGYFAHVEVAHKRKWHFKRSDKKNYQNGFKDCAKALVSDKAIWSGRADCWGSRMVERAAQGFLDDGGNPRRKFGQVGKWIGPRMNQHITQQAFDV